MRHRERRFGRGAVFALCASSALVASGAWAQTFYDVRPGVPTDEFGDPDVSGPLRSMSMLFINVPEPRRYGVHDLVTLIIDETSAAESKQSLDTKKEYDISGGVESFPDLIKLLELRLEGGDRQNLASLGIDAEQEFKGSGTAKRSDRFVARITAEIIDVKPNGTLVLEARKTVASQNGESKTIVLSGVCRQEDITRANTINSSQLANLRISQTTEGEVAKSSRKGLIPRVLEAIFNF
jgi:flagellar L-ring protein FlgH